MKVFSTIVRVVLFGVENGGVGGRPVDGVRAALSRGLRNIWKESGIKPYSSEDRMRSCPTHH